MYQYDDATVQATLPTPAAQGTGGFFTDGNPSLGVPATILRADFMNMLMMEILNVLAAGGVTPSKSTYNQLLTAINNIVGTSAGTAVTSIVQGTGITVSRTGNTVTISASGSGGGSATVTLVVPSFLTVSAPITGTGTLTIGYSGQALPTSVGGTGATSAASALAALGGLGAAQGTKQTGITIGANQTLYNTLSFQAPSNGRIVAFAALNLLSSGVNVGHNVSINGGNTIGDIYGVTTMEMTSALVSANSLNTIQQAVIAGGTPPSAAFSMQLFYVFIPATS